jgi:hypothetical protein
VANALSPAQVISVDIDEEHRIASVTVPERMLSLAIGREGQNARLAARLTGWRIDIRSDVSVAEAKAAADAKATEPAERDAEPVTADAEPVTADAEAAPAPEAAPEIPAKPKRTTKKAAEVAATTEPTNGVVEAKPKRVTKKAAAAADATPPAETTEPTDGEPAVEAVAAPAKPKRTTKKAAEAAPTTEEVAS